MSALHLNREKTSPQETKNSVTIPLKKVENREKDTFFNSVGGIISYLFYYGRKDAFKNHNIKFVCVFIERHRNFHHSNIDQWQTPQ